MIDKLIMFVVLLIIYYVGKIFGYTPMESLKSGSHDDPTLPLTVENLPFHRIVEAPKPTHNRHHGQRKLFLAELELLNLTNNDGKPRLFVYAGAAPCMHLGLLMDLFPDVKFLLIDPNEFWITHNDKIHYEDTSGRFIYLKSNSVETYDPNVKRSIVGPDSQIYTKGQSPDISINDIIKYVHMSDAQVFIYEDYCTVDLAGAISNDLFYTIFMSDIRTNSTDGEPAEVDILWNDSQFFNWVCHMKPDIGSHKNRLPYLGTKAGEPKDYMIADFEESKRLGIDFLHTDPNDGFTYFDGLAYLQAWMSSGSTETRLIFTKHDNEKLHDTTYNNVIGSSYINKYGVPGNYIDIPEGYTPKKTDPFTLPGIPYLFRKYDIIEYEQKLLYHNRVNKGLGHFDKGPVDDCYDCALEMSIWEQYNKGHPKNKIGVEETMLTLHDHLGSKYSKSNDSHSLAELHKKTTKVYRYPGSTNPEIVKAKLNHK